MPLNLAVKVPVTLHVGEAVVGELGYISPGPDVTAQLADLLDEAVTELRGPATDAKLHNPERGR